MTQLTPADVDVVCVGNLTDLIVTLGPWRLYYCAEEGFAFWAHYDEFFTFVEVEIGKA